MTKQYIVTFVAVIKADNEDEAKIKTVELMRDPWEFHEDCGCSIEEDIHD